MNIIAKIKDVNILLSGGKKFYNNYASTYNDLVKTFPYNLLAKKKTYNISRRDYDSYEN